MQDAMYHVSVEDASGNAINTAAYQTEIRARRGAETVLRNPLYASPRLAPYPSGIAVELTRSGLEAMRGRRHAVRPTLRRSRMRAT